ncbi:MAG: hypothetical protein QOJ90_2394 [Actinomycetota bacterium]|nr:hypothetical protein [Actinomycetota bacterium]
MTTTHLSEAPAASPAHATARSRLSALALAGAGVGIVLGHLLTVPPTGKASVYVADLAAHRTTGVIGGLLTAVGAFLLVPGLAAVLRLVPERGARLATIGAVLAGTGIVALGAGDVMITLVMGSLVEKHADLATTLFKISDTEPLIGLPFALAPLFVLGMVLLGIALFRARTVPIWLAVLTIVGAVGVFFSSAGGASAFIPLLPLGIALVGLGTIALRRPA